MKTFSIALLLIGFFTVAQAQIVAMEPVPNALIRSLSTAEASPSIDEAAKAERYQRHTQLAVRTLTEYLSAELDYPAPMAEHEWEDTASVTVQFDQSGRIVDWAFEGKIDNSFKREIVVALAHMPPLPIKGKTYHGGRKLLVPVQFNLQ